jgi:hypothetical protein
MFYLLARGKIISEGLSLDSLIRAIGILIRMSPELFCETFISAKEDLS